MVWRSGTDAGRPGLDRLSGNAVRESRLGCPVTHHEYPDTPTLLLSMADSLSFVGLSANPQSVWLQWSRDVEGVPEKTS